MEKVTTLNKSNIKDVRQKIQTILDEAGEELGLQIKMGNISYDALSLRSKLEVKVLNGANADDLEKREFEKSCVICGLKPEDYNKEIKYMGQSYLIVGIATRSRRYPIIVKSKNSDKQYKLPLDALKHSAAVGEKTCKRCVDGKIKITVEESGKKKLVDITCIYCDGTGTQIHHYAEEEEGFWCKCGNNDNVTYYDNGKHPKLHKHHYRCNNCDAVVQIG